MKDRKRRERELVLPGSRRFLSFLALLIFCAFCSTCVFSTFRFIGVSFRPVLLTSGRNPSINAVAVEYNSSHEYATRRRIFRQSPVRLFDAVVFPDQILVFVNDPAGDSPPLDNNNLQCLFYGPNSPDLELALPLISIDGRSPLLRIARCPLPPRRLNRVSLRDDLPPSAISRTWQSLAYKALIDAAADNTTVVFVKGVSLRAEKVAEPSRFECVYGWNFTRGRFLRSPALSVAQEIVRCPTPLALLNQPRLLSSVKVSVNVKGRGVFPSVARPDLLRGGGAGRGKPYNLCVCTMVRNQAKFLHEWVAYHARVGVERWFIYDNNSDDGLEDAVRVLDGLGHNVSVHDWPWIKTQEAGFAHCALRARDSCEWVGFIDVDEFLHLPSLNQTTVHDVLANHSDPWVGELRTSCLSFGPSGLKLPPPEGVTVGYTCRMAAPERHKSIVRPEALNSTLINVVHHFHLREGYEYVNVERGAMVINHYKYQVWDVFKEKFNRRVATYVADWQENENEGSKDRAPGLGTRAVEPQDWSSRFCEVTDSGLRNWVLQEFVDPQTRLLPWQHKLFRGVKID